MTRTDIDTRVRTLALGAPLRWLGRGWRDFRLAPLPGLMHGVAFLVAAVLILAAGWGRYALLAGAFSGFLLVAPMLSTGLYETSRRIARGELPTMRDVARVWVDGGAAMVRLGVLLALFGTAWVALSALIVAASGVDVGARGGVTQFLRVFVLSPDWLPFASWLLAGGLLAAIVFAASALSMPMMLDREVGLRTAVLASVRAVGSNPGPMAAWAGLVMALTLVSIVTVVPLLFLVPVLGHATWHAYEETIDPDGLPPRL